jgi:probable HAF family extracellular repeat protein
MSAIDNPTADFPTTHPFFWSRQTGMVDIGSFGGSFGSANALNNRGQVAGEAYSTGDATDHAFIWSKSDGIRDLGTLGGTYSAATNLNDLGHVVGVSSVASGFTHTFLWRRGKMIDLGVVPGDE